jgi:hypothetical protein
MNEFVAGTEGSSHNPQCQLVSPTTEASIFMPSGFIGESRLAVLNTVGQYGTCDEWFEQMSTPCGDVQNQRRIGSSSGDTLGQPIPSWHGFGSGPTSLGSPFHNDEAMNNQPRSGHDSYPQSTRSNQGVERRSKKVNPRPRLQCPGCNLTFPRKYELNRHKSTIHDRKVSILCSVYGCSRVSQPFHRIDKFNEHFRKHQKGPERFLCVLETCRQGPLTREELVGHLKDHHLIRTIKQVEPHLDHALSSLGLRLSFPSEASPIIGDLRACPLWIYGCGFKSDIFRDVLPWLTDSHLSGHELLERSKGYEVICAAFGRWEAQGVATCPICKTQVCTIRTEGFPFLHSIVRHVDVHTNEERREHAIEIAQMFRPYLMGQEETGVWNDTNRILKWNLDPEFRARVEEAGVLSAPVQTPEGSELQLGNAHGPQGMDFQA